MEEGKRNKLAKICWEVLKEKSKMGRVKSGWEEERKKFFNNRGVELEEVKRKKMEGEWFSSYYIDSVKGQRDTKEREMERINRSQYTIISGIKR